MLIKAAHDRAANVSNPNRMTIHDLRVAVDGRVARIDHLMIDRLLGIEASFPWIDAVGSGR